ncbi:protein hapless 2 [Quercus suber]|uniref:Protein hapless 2 n=1 Tax=Quercus suber TaxID=58331 RepID=A0AAW0IJ62_QUESU
MNTKTTILFLLFVLASHGVAGVQILSKSKLQKCEKSSESGDLNCTKKIVLNMAVPSGSSGGEASIVAEIVEVEDNSSSNMQTLRIPPVLTSIAITLANSTIFQDVPYKPEELYVKTRKCQPDADAKVVQICYEMIKVTLLSIPRFHVFGIGQRSLGFSVQIQVKTGSKISEVVVGPENRTATSNDNFLRVNLIGDFAGYTNIPTFEDFYLVIPRQGGPGQPQNLGGNFSLWMLLERVRFTLDGLECNKIGVSFEAFNGQPNFCASPFWSCLHNQLWNFKEADKNRITRNQLPLYGVEGRFERINQHPNAGSHSFSIGVTEVLNTNLLLELSADDIEYVYQRSPGKILSVSIPTFEALTQFGVATITTKNTGELEASYSLTLLTSIRGLQEQFFIMKPKEIMNRTFKLYPTTDQAAKYVCAAILKDSTFNEADRAECQFTTTATVLDNGTQSTPFQPPESGINGFFDSIESIWNKIWRVLVLLWLLHQKGLFDPLYDWWEDHFGDDNQSIRQRNDFDHHHIHVNKHREQPRHHKHGAHHNRRSNYNERRHNHSGRDTDYNYYLDHVHKEKHKHRRSKHIGSLQQVDDNIGHHRRRKERETMKGLSKASRYI